MCLAIPGKIIKIEEKIAIVQYPNEQRKVMIDPNIPIKIGDFVLVQMGIIIQKIEEEQAMESWQMWKSMEKP